MANGDQNNIMYYVNTTLYKCTQEIPIPPEHISFKSSNPGRDHSVGEGVIISPLLAYFCHIKYMIKQ